MNGSLVFIGGFLLFIYIIYWIAKKILRKYFANRILLNGLAILAVLATFMVLLFDQMPFYWYAKYLYGRDGGVVMAKAAPEEQGYMTKGNCEIMKDEHKLRRFDVTCYYRLFESASSLRTLKFIEFELTPEIANYPSPFYERQGPGVYRIVLEKVPFKDCLVMQDLDRALSKIDSQYLQRDNSSDVKRLYIAKTQNLCPVVLKVDQPISKHRDESDGKSQVVFSTGIHRIFRSSWRHWLSIDRKTSLFQRVDYCVEGAIILWGNKSDLWPPNPCVSSRDEQHNVRVHDPFELSIDQQPESKK